MKQTKTLPRQEFVSAVLHLNSSRNIDEWNLIRREAKKTLTLEEISQIDSSGLIGEVRDKNNWPKKEQ